MFDKDYNMMSFKLDKVVLLSNRDFRYFSDNLLDNYDFLTSGGTGSDMDMPEEYLNEKGMLIPAFYGNTKLVEEFRKTSYSLGQLIMDRSGRCFVVDTQGYGYARYCAFFTDGSDPLNCAQPIEMKELDKFIDNLEKKEEQDRKEHADAMRRAYGY